MIKKVKAIFFDLGDTLLDTKIINPNEHFESIKEILKIYGLKGNPCEYFFLARKASKKAQEAYERFFGHVSLEKFDSQKSGEFLTKTFCRDIIILMGQKPENKVIGQVYRAYLRGTATANSLFPGTKKVLKMLKRKFRLGIITNNTIEFAEGPLLNLGLKPFFDVVVISGKEGVGILKPISQIFFRALKQLEIKPQEAAMVGNCLQADIEGAKNIGMVSIWLNRRDNNSDLLVKPDFTIQNITELLKIFPFE